MIKSINYAMSRNLNDILPAIEFFMLKTQLNDQSLSFDTKRDLKCEMNFLMASDYPLIENMNEKGRRMQRVPEKIN